MRHGSLFSGIGGFDLAAEWMGWENVFHCEWNEFGQKILKHYWPNAKSYGDITKTDFTEWRGKVDIVSGGFPCQPFSFAGIRKGEEDNRFLWPEMLRAVREIKPGWVVGENVSGILTSNKGMVFEQIQIDLEAEGYEIQPVLLPAISVGADHIRERVWFVAHSCGVGWKDVQGHNRSGKNKTSYTEGRREKGEKRNKETNELDSSCNTFLRFQKMYGESPIFNVDDGLPFELDGITVPKWIEQSHTAAGNSIHPSIAYEIFKAIEFIN